MATSTDIPITVETEKQDAVIAPDVSENIENNYAKIKTNECFLSENERIENASTNKIYLANEKISTSWNNLETESMSSVPQDTNSACANEDICVKCVKQPDSDGKQNIIDQSMLFNPENWTVSGDSQIWLESCRYNNNFQSFGRKSGGYKTNSTKINFSHSATSPNCPFNQGTSACHQLPRSNSSNAMNYSAAMNNGQHIVHLHVNPGETISFYMGDHMQLIQGPATVRMVSSNSTPPVPMPVQVPPGHMVQQIVDEQGTLRHIILSPQPPVAVSVGNPYNSSTGAGNVTSPSTGSAPFYLYPHQSYSLPSQFHLHMQPGLTGQGLHSPNEHLQPQPNHSQSSNQGLTEPSSSSHLNTFKDERTQRQFFKLKKRLESRQKDTSNSPQAFNSDTHGKPSKDQYQQEDLPEKQSTQKESELLEELSSIKIPSIIKISSKSALLKWTPLELKREGKDSLSEVKESELLYLILLCDKNRDPKPKVVYRGCDFEYHLTDLKPASSYHVRVQVTLNGISGNASESLLFKTLSCEPETPQPPKLISRTKTTISLKWNAAVDNGSKIVSYILEYDEGNGTDKFVELFTGLQKQYKAVKLKASTCYKFRLTAVNEHGKSSYSEISCFSTSGSTPSQPMEPTLTQAYINRLMLDWEPRPNDDSYTLQMEDEKTLHGFLPVYNGKETSYLCLDLKRNTSYKFRLCAINEEGSSPWSQVVVFSLFSSRANK